MRESTRNCCDIIVFVYTSYTWRRNRASTWAHRRIARACARPLSSIFYITASFPDTYDGIITRNIRAVPGFVTYFYRGRVTRLVRRYRDYGRNVWEIIDNNETGTAAPKNARRNINDRPFLAIRECTTTRDTHGIQRTGARTTTSNGFLYVN